MLSKNENELLCHVGPGTPMGDYLRSFWLPVLLAEELPERDCPPVRVRVLGENLVAFKATDGSIGLLDEICPHRRASLFWGRNEEQGLRCVYHGWKYDTEGNCVDMPNEPAEYEFRRRVRMTAYPATEHGGVIWAYMGPADKTPELPEIEWARVPAGHRTITKRLQETNFLQAVEGGIDASHVSFLHRGFRPGSESGEALGLTKAPTQAGWMIRDTSPRFTVQRTDYGLMIGARRDADAGKYYWRITQFLLPSYTMIPTALDLTTAISGHVWVPIDDQRCWTFSATWNPSRPFTDVERAEHASGDGIHTQVDAGYYPLRNHQNDYLVDRRAQSRGASFTGINGISEQDMAVQESMGTIVDRSLERLGTSDTAMIAMRRLLLRAVRDRQRGIQPYAAQHGSLYRVRSASVVLEPDVPFEEGAKEALISRA